MAKFTVDTHLFRELGELLVGRDSTALIELIKNAYDADATEVTVYGERLDNPEEGHILVTDNGVGMNTEAFDERFSESCFASEGAGRAAVRLYSNAVTPVRRELAGSLLISLRKNSKLIACHGSLNWMGFEKL